MKKLFLFSLAFQVLVISCKKQQPEAIHEADECNPKDPVTYYELKDADVIVAEMHKASGRFRVFLKDTINMNAKFKLFYPELIHELAPDCCPCNLPLQFQKEGQKLRISGLSKIEKSDLKFYQNLVENPTNQPHDDDECLPFEITNIEAIE